MTATLRDIVVADIGGTHARFAIATLDGARVVALGAETVLKTAEHESLQKAWEKFRASLDQTLPRTAGIAVAAPVHGEVLKLTNNPWLIRPAALKGDLGLDHLTLINDFAAVGHAVAQADDAHLQAILGPPGPLPREGLISVLGPGTGLGVAQVLRRSHDYQVISTEGGHISFAPFDQSEEAILSSLHRRFPRVSVERLVSGPGLANIYAAISDPAKAIAYGDDATLWAAAIAGEDESAAAALQQFCRCYGSYAGDVALLHGASAVVIAGSLSQRLADRLNDLGFAQRFVDKGRFTALLQSIPVRLLVHPQPGLFGAAAACALEAVA